MAGLDQGDHTLPSSSCHITEEPSAPQRPISTTPEEHRGTVTGRKPKQRFKEGTHCPGPVISPILEA